MDSYDRNRQPSSSRNMHSTPDNDSNELAAPEIRRHPSPVKKSGFPLFSEGDVLILSPTGKQWRLHSLILSQGSPVFNRIFSTTEPAHITKKDRDAGKTIVYKLDMFDDPQMKRHDPDGLRLKAFRAVSINSRAFTLPLNVNGLGGEVSYDRVYDNFFRCLYNLKPEMEQDDDDLSRNYITDCTSLLLAAEFLDAIPVVRVVVEAHLLRLHQVLWHHISSKAENWVYIAAKLQSPLMFRECMLHLVGKYHLQDGVNMTMLRDEEHGELGQKICNLIEYKAKELKDKKMKVERQLLEYYPARIVHKEDATTVPGRAIYANDIYMWQALAICRQYFASVMMVNGHHRAIDGGLAFYRAVGSADGSYIRPDTLDRYNICFEMSSKGKVCLAAALDTIKGDLRPVVKELLVDRSQATRTPDHPQFPHFTCTEIHDEELPWDERPAVKYKDNKDIKMIGMGDDN